MLDEADGDPDQEEGCDDDHDIVDEPHDDDELDEGGDGESFGTGIRKGLLLTPADVALIETANRLRRGRHP